MTKPRVLKKVRLFKNDLEYRLRISIWRFEFQFSWLRGEAY